MKLTTNVNEENFDILYDNKETWNIMCNITTNVSHIRVSITKKNTSMKELTENLKKLKLEASKLGINLDISNEEKTSQRICYFMFKNLK